MCNVYSCASPILLDFMKFFKQCGFSKIEIYSAMPQDTLYVVRRNVELKAIEASLVRENGDFAPHEYVQEGLGKVYDKFDLGTFEESVKAFLDHMRSVTKDETVRFRISYG